MTRSSPLSDLQTVDSQRDSAAARLKQVVVALRGRNELQRAQAELESVEAALSDVERRLRAHELERQSVKDRIARENRTLYGGRVTAPKELQNLQAEIASLERHLGELDDRALELMLERDEISGACDAARSKLAMIERETESMAKTLTAEKEELAAKIRALDSRRAEIVSVVPPADLALYDRLRKAKGGRAVSELTGDHCGACGMQLPRHSHELAKSGQQIVLCTGCGRILHR